MNKSSSDYMPNLCFFAQTIGHLSETWMWRQLVGFKRVRPYILTWAYINQKTFKLDNIPICILPFDTKTDEGVGRWFYRFRCLPERNFYASVGAERRFIKKWLSNLRPQVMLCQFGHSALHLLPIARKLDIPIVAHFHGLDLSSSLRNRWYRWSLLLALKHFTSIVVVGSHQMRWMIEHGVPEERVHLIPCGVPTQLLKPTKRESSECVKFIAVSRLVEKKGVEYTIRAFAKIRTKVRNAKLMIIGDGPLHSKLENLVHQLGLSEQITFAGFIEPDRVKQQLLDADIFVQHSIISSQGDMEGWPVGIAEASACSLPVVVTRGCGGTEEQVLNGKTGFLVEQKDVDGMADCMLKLARDPSLRAKLGQAGRDRMVREFDTVNQIAKLEAVLLNSVKKRASY